MYKKIFYGKNKLINKRINFKKLKSSNINVYIDTKT